MISNLASKKSLTVGGKEVERAFLEVFSNGSVVAYGKWLDNNGKWRPGPRTGIIAKVPEHLRKEAKHSTWKQPKSQELENWLQTVWKEAKNVYRWFESF